jgi:elongation factor P
MINVNDLRKGVTFELDGALYRVLNYEHHKPGRGNAVIRTKIRNLRTGSTLERTFQSGDRVQDVRLDHQTVQFLFSEGNLYTFMDTETFEQHVLSEEHLGDAVNYLSDGLTVELMTYNGEPIEVELPTTVDLLITEAEPGIAGDTATSAMKQVTVQSGLKVMVPLFVNQGDTIRIDTRTGTYLTRV